MAACFGFSKAIFRVLAVLALLFIASASASRAPAAPAPAPTSDGNYFSLDLKTLYGILGFGLELGFDCLFWILQGLQ